MLGRILLTWALIAWAGAAQAQERIALLIGNKGYSAEVGPLDNPHNDVDAIRASLLQVGFASANIRVVKDASRRELLSEVNAFARRAEGLGPDDLAVFYYSGHGATEPGQDSLRLIPVDAKDVDDEAFWFDTIDLNDQVIRTFEGSGSQAAWVLALDACRNELRIPTRNLGGADKGFGVVPTSAGMLIAFAADQGQTARDRYAGSTLSPYAEVLAAELLQPNRTLSALFGAVRPSVMTKTGSAQEPVYTNKLNRDLVLVSAPATLPVRTEDPLKPMFELMSEPCDFYSFAQVYRGWDSPYVEMARERGETCGQLTPAPRREPTPTPTPAMDTIVVKADRIPRPGDAFKDCDACPEMVVIPAGSFMMGSTWSEAGRNDNEGPQRSVSIPEPFAVSKFEVTWGQWDACVAATYCGMAPVTIAPRHETVVKPNHPVTLLDDSDINNFLRWLNQHAEGNPYRLLTEAEWEYAARAGTTEPFSFGQISPSKARYDFSKSYAGSATGRKPSGSEQVGRFAANGFGLFDMHGNVAEWVAECYDRQDSAGRPLAGEVYQKSGCSRRISRGGSWNSAPDRLRSAYRYGDSPIYRYNTIGLRIARDLAD